MIIKEEENIMVESKDYIFVFSIDYVNDGFFVTVYDKKQEKNIVVDYKIHERIHRKQIFETINKEPGTIFRVGNGKFMVRNHDRSVWNDEAGGQPYRNIVSDDSCYDTRYTADIPILSRVAVSLKEVWLKI